MDIKQPIARVNKIDQRIRKLTNQLEKLKKQRKDVFREMMAKRG